MNKKITDKAIKPEREIRNDYEPTNSEYYFHGEGKYQPAKIIASSLKEATEIYQTIKKLI